MSLFSSLQIANNALIANQLGLEVVGNNIANANTPGYVREELLVTPSPAIRVGGVLQGTGVDILGIVQKTDRFLEERLRGAVSDLTSSDTQDQTYVQLESLLGELSDTDLSSILTKFFGAIHDVLNQPESLSVRNVAIQQGQRLADDIRHLDARVRDVRAHINDRIAGTADDINAILKKVADLNIKIATFEGGELSQSDAVGLRDERTKALNDLSKFLNIKTSEQENASVTVFVGGDFLVHEGTYRTVSANYTYDRGLAIAEIKLDSTDASLEFSSGELAGLADSRDTILGGFLDQLGTYTGALINEFNKVFTSGQGLSGYTEELSEFAVSNNDAALDDAGLEFTPVNGSFQVHVYNTKTRTTDTTDVLVKLNGLDDDTTLNDLASALAAIDGITATITADRHLEITSDSQILQFTFANDTSGVLAALGISTFFNGTTSSDISIDEVLLNDPSKFSASRGGIGADTTNAELLAALQSSGLDSQNGLSLANLYDNLLNGVAQSAASTRALTEGYRSFHATLESAYLSITGVSLDEEAIKMITYQRSYQASARYVRALSELLDTLVNL